MIFENFVWFPQNLGKWDKICPKLFIFDVFFLNQLKRSIIWIKSFAWFCNLVSFWKWQFNIDLVSIICYSGLPCWWGKWIFRLRQRPGKSRFFIFGWGEESVKNGGNTPGPNCYWLNQFLQTATRFLVSLETFTNAFSVKAHKFHSFFNKFGLLKSFLTYDYSYS